MFKVEMAEQDWFRLMQTLGELANVDDILREPVRVIAGDALRDAFDLNFAAEGPMWEPLRPRTIAERERLGFEGKHPILERTGQLRFSATDASHPDHVEEMGQVSDGVFILMLGSNHPHYDLLHFGGMNSSNRPVPARPMMVIHDFQFQQLDDAFERIVTSAFGLD